MSEKPETDHIHDYLQRRVHKISGERFRSKHSRELARRQRHARHILEAYDEGKYASVLGELIVIREHLKIEAESLHGQLEAEGIKPRRGSHAAPLREEFDVLAHYIKVLRQKISARKHRPANDR